MECVEGESLAQRIARVYRPGMIGFDVSADGQKFLLVVAADENTRPLTLLQNWPSLLATK